MRKNFITNISFLLLLNLLVKPFWIIGIDRSVQNAVGPDAYGVYFSLFNFSFLFQVILDFGINNFNNRLVASRPERLGGYLYTTLIAKLLLSLIYLIILFIAAFGIRFSGTQLNLLGALALMQILMSFYSFLRSNVSALHLFKTDAVLSVLDKVITSVICAIILWTQWWRVSISVQLFVEVQIAGYIAALTVALMIILRQRISIQWKFDKKILRTIFYESYPYALLGFLMTAYYRTDGVMIERMLGDQGAYEAGIYASAFRLMDALNILGFMFAGLLLPMFARMIENREDIRPLLDLSFKMMLLFCGTGGITCLFFRQQIMELLYTSGSSYSATIFGWLMISFIAISLTYIFGSLITAHGSIRKLNILSLTGFFVNLVLNALLIPELKALGSSIATVCTQIVILGAHIYIAGKLFSLPFEFKKWMPVFLFLLCIVAVNFGVQFLPIQWYMQFGLAISLSVAAVVPAGIIRFSDLRTFLSNGLSSLRKKA